MLIALNSFLFWGRYFFDQSINTTSLLFFKLDICNKIGIFKILKKFKKGNKILVDDGKFTFVVTGKKGLAVTTVCKSQNCYMKSNKSVHIPNFDIAFNKLTSKDKRDIKSAIKLGCNWIALSYLQNEKLILEARKLIKKDMGIISKIENKHALKNIIKIYYIICVNV